MREYRFRGRIPGRHWVYGGLSMPSASEAYIHVGDGVGRAVAVEPETVGEWTGLCDSGGCEIFEGDLVRLSSGIVGDIVFDSSDGDSTGFILRGSKKPYVSSFNFNLSEAVRCSVIGNIYDDPSLLMHGAWESPEEYAVRTGRELAPYDAVYQFMVDEWVAGSYEFALNHAKLFPLIVCANNENGCPPSDWRPLGSDSKSVCGVGDAGEDAVEIARILDEWERDAVEDLDSAFLETVDSHNACQDSPEIECDSLSGNTADATEKVAVE